MLQSSREPLSVMFYYFGDPFYDDDDKHLGIALFYSVLLWPLVNLPQDKWKLDFFQ